MVLDPIPQSLPVHFFGSRPQPPTSRIMYLYRVADIQHISCCRHRSSAVPLGAISPKSQLHIHSISYIGQCADLCAVTPARTRILHRAPCIKSLQKVRITLTVYRIPLCSKVTLYCTLRCRHSHCVSYIAPQTQPLLYCTSRRRHSHSAKKSSCIVHGAAETVTVKNHCRSCIALQTQSLCRTSPRKHNHVVWYIVPQAQSFCKKMCLGK